MYCILAVCNSTYRVLAGPPFWIPVTMIINKPVPGEQAFQNNLIWNDQPQKSLGYPYARSIKTIKNEWYLQVGGTAMGKKHLYQGMLIFYGQMGIWSLGEMPHPPLPPQKKKKKKKKKSLNGTPDTRMTFFLSDSFLGRFSLTFSTFCISSSTHITQIQCWK